MSKKLMIANRKGGVGKTSTAINLSSALAQLGARVLLVDMDTQSHCAVGLGLTPTDQGVHQIFLNSQQSALDQELSHQSETFTTSKNASTLSEAQVSEAQSWVVSTGVEGLDLLPADKSFESWAATDDLLRLRHLLLREFDQKYDWIVLDTPPSQDISLMSSLCAADEVIIPVLGDRLSYTGVKQFTAMFFKIAMRYNPRLKLRGLVPMLYNRHLPTQRQVMEDLLKHYGEQKILPAIPRDAKVPESYDAGQPLVLYAPNCFASQAYLELARKLS